MQPGSIEIERRKITFSRFGLPNSTGHLRIRKGLMPGTITLPGGRNTGFLKHEIDAWAAMIVAGASDDDVRLVVSLLRGTRQRGAFAARKITQAISDGVSLVGLVELLEALQPTNTQPAA